MTFTFAARATVEVVNNYDDTKTFVDLVGIARGSGRTPPSPTS